MPYRFAYRRYRLPFKAPVRTAHGPWTEREGVLVRLENEAGAVGWGEAAPVPGFGRETAEEAEAACRGLGEFTSGEVSPAEPACFRHALGTALAEVTGRGQVADGNMGYHPQPDPLAKSLPVAALLPAGRASLGVAKAFLESGFRVFKWKVAVGDPADELALLDDLCAELPPGALLRLDANGGWDRRWAGRWLERCADRPIEFVEQPVPRGEDDLLRGLAGDYPTAVALDESLADDGDIERWLGAGWPGVFVVKTTLLADAAGALARLAASRAPVVFSSALETAVGAKSALRAAFAWPGQARALGFGVWPLFADARFDGPYAAPFLRRQDVERIDPEAAWNALT